MNLNLVLFLAAVLLSDPVERSGGSSASSAPEVRSHGALRQIMHEGRTGSVVRRSGLPQGSGLWGVGALENLSGEVTFVDGTMWLSRPGKKGPRTTVNEKGDPGFALLVTSVVPKWRSFEVTQPLTLAELGTYAEAKAREAGLNPDAPFALRVEGQVKDLGWHVVDGTKLKPGGSHHDHVRAAQRGTLSKGTARLVGFYSQRHAGVWTHHGERTHLHAVIDGKKRVTGHLDAVTVLPGARLFLPERSP